MASCLNLEDALGVNVPDNGRIMRNLVLGANFVMSHILHFYHLAALDYINTDGVLGGAIDKGPWRPHYVAPDMVTGGTAATLVGHYIEALAIRRKAHQMAAIFGGKLPCAPSFVPGGCTEVVTSHKISAFRALLNEQRAFIDGTYIPDVTTVATAFPAYSSIGIGCGNLLSYGVFDIAPGTKLLARGRITGVNEGPVYPGDIIEYLKYSKYTGPNTNPADGVTNPNVRKAGAYSWLKAPRYADVVYEVGPLARMLVNHDYEGGISVVDRHAARALEAKKVADAMDGWLDELAPGAPAYERVDVPMTASGIGLTEAPRGALGHWIDISGGKISRYQVVTPTNWNASPMDDLGQKGPIEQALLDTPVADLNNPIEVLRVVHSFDPCLACSVHMLRPGKDKPVAVVQTRPSI